VTTACGGDGGDKQTETAPSRTVDVDMVDNAFRPATLTAAPGERIRFVFRNNGKAVHDAFIGDAAAQAEHEKEMREADGDAHGGGHDVDGDALTVDPGKSGELTYTFEGTGTVEIGCHQPGHYAAGMKLAMAAT
ncbi:MAG: hypothetical protein M3357_07960, partial [Actinomycetota bacterium]|nr:hypothetical protein [Actinomycetota bacterium]